HRVKQLKEELTVTTETLHERRLQEKRITHRDKRLPAIEERLKEVRETNKQLHQALDERVGPNAKSSGNTDSERNEICRLCSALTLSTLEEFELSLLRDEMNQLAEWKADWEDKKLQDEQERLAFTRKKL